MVHLIRLGRDFVYQNFKDRGSLFHCIGKPKNMKFENPFWHFGYRNFKRQGVSLPLHQETPKHEMRKAISSFRLSGLLKIGGLSSTALGNPETRNTKRSFEDRCRVMACGHLG
jgi:hypothetical protein